MKQTIIAVMLVVGMSALALGQTPRVNSQHKENPLVVTNAQHKENPLVVTNSQHKETPLPVTNSQHKEGPVEAVTNSVHSMYYMMTHALALPRGD